MKRYKHSLSLLFLLKLLAIRSSAEELTLNVNFKQPISVTDERFLSLTVDPTALVHGNALSTDFERSISLAKALSPAYIRLGGPRGTFYQSVGQYSKDDEGNRNSILSETEWVLAHQWAEKAGLDVIACIRPESVTKEHETSSENLKDATDIVSFSDHMGLDANWQLGYECQTRCNISANDLANQVVHLRKTLNAFPRYSKSIVIGPDVVAYETEKQRQYLRDYFNYAAPALSAITWHPDLDSISLDNEGVLIHQDNLDRDKEELYKVIGRFAKKRPLWIAESKPEECKNLYLGALVLARRLGNAAKSKVDVVMRQPSDLTQPTPDYWVSLLHKTLVGRQVFHANVQTLNKSHVYLYCQCTKTSSRYDQGAVTIFGVNLSPENVQFDLKGAKITTLHQYILSPGFDTPNRMFAESILLNNETLTLVNNMVPDVKPVILKDPKGLALNLHSGGIGFWVLPEFQIKSCIEPQEVLETQNRRSNIRVPRDAREKVHVARSVQDRGNARSEKRKERDDSRVTGKPDARRELKRLRKFVRKELNDYDAQRSSNSKAESGSISRVKSVDEQSKQQDDTQTKLQEFKDRFSRIRDRIRMNGGKVAIGSSINNRITETIALISKVQDALDTVKRETDDTNKVQASNNVKENLKLLYDLLTRASLTDSNDSSESEEDKLERRAKRAKRDLMGQIANPSWDLNRGSLLRKRSRAEDVKERRTDPKFGTREDIRVQPRVVELGTSDSGENTFYGFFRTDPVQGFPEGNVFFATADHPRSSNYDDTRSEAAGATDYDDAEYDYGQRYYESVESMENSHVPNTRVAPAELWEAETYERQRNGKSGEEGDVQPDEQQETRDNQSYLRRLTGYYGPSASQNDRTNTYDRSKLERGRSVVRPVRFRRTPATTIELADQRTKMSDYNVHSGSKGADFSIDGDVRDNKRAKRESTDLNAILDQEMIKEDDANSRDCNCRVIRRSKPCIHRLKREASTPVEYEINTKVVPQHEITVDSNADASDSNLHATDVEVFSELGASPVEILELQTEPLSLKIERNAEASLPSELNLDMQEIQTERESIEAHTESSSFQLDSSSMSSLNIDDDLDSSLKTDVRRDDSTFFRGEEEKPAINTFENAARYTSSSWENSTPVTKENDAEADEAAKEIQVSRAETSSTILEPATLSKDIAKGPENDYNNDTVARGSFKRQVESESSSETSSTAEGERENLSTRLTDNSKSKKRRMKYSSNRRASLSDARVKKMQMLDNAKVLLALKKMIGKEKGRQAVESTTLEPNDKVRQYQRTRTEQIEQLKNKLRERRQKLMQQYKNSFLETVDKVVNGERRNLKIREAGDATKGSNEFAHVLIQEPIVKDVEQEEGTIDVSTAKRDVPVTELVRARNVRERIFHPKNQQNFRQSAIMKRSHPTNLMEEIIQLRDLYDNVAARGERFGDDNGENDKSYFALVEDLDSPRIFHYQQQPQDQQKINLQVISPRSRFRGSKYSCNSPQQRPYQENLDIIESSSEEGEEESDELPRDREVYILDPSKYRGGQPTLQLYRDPSKPRRTNQKVISKNAYETIWEPVLYKSYKIHQARQPISGDETSISVDSQESNDEIENLAKLRDLSKNLHTEELLDILINALDLQSARELSKMLTDQNVVNIKKRNFMRSISEEPREEQSQENVGQVKEESEVERNPEEGKPSEVSRRQEAAEKTGNYQDSLMGRETKGEEDDTSSEQPIVQDSASGDNLEVHLNGEEVAKLRKRRDIGSQIEKDYSDWLPSFFKRKAPREIKRTGQNNFLCLRENLGGTSDEDPSKVFKIVKESEYYKAVPINRPAKELKKRFLPVTTSRNNDDHPRDTRDFPGRLKIVIPSKLSDRYWSNKMAEDPMIGSKNPHVGLSVNYQEDSDSLENKSGLAKSEESLDDASSDYVDENTSDILELYNTGERRDESGEESEENVNLKDLLLSEQPEVLMVLPWAKRLGRLRRQATEQEKIDENEGVEKVQPLELQQLEELSSPRISTYNDVDDVEKSIAQKTPLEKYTRKENLVANYINERKDLGKSGNEDRGLPSFIEGNIPKLQNVVVDGLEKVQNFTGSVEQLVEDLNEKFDEASNINEQKDYVNAASTGIAQNAFHNAIMGVQKIFTLLGGITHILRG